jgi:predicted component of type VI protein secretion system
VPPFLIMQRGPEIGRRYDITSSQFTIGRGSDNDLVLGDALVSRYHAVIRQENEGIVIIDLGSTNPVTVNDVELEPGVPQRLHHRDVIVVGQSVFSFQHPTSVAAPPARVGAIHAPPRPAASEPATIVAPGPVGPAPARPEPPVSPETVPWAAGPARPAAPQPSGGEPARPGGLPRTAPPAVPPDEASTVISPRPGGLGPPPAPPPAESRPPAGETARPPGPPVPPDEASTVISPRPGATEPLPPDDDTPTIIPPRSSGL